MNIIVKCDNKINPICTSKNPQFSWYLENFEECGAFQVSYRIVVSDKNNKVYWDSGRVESSENSFITYNGEKLLGHTKYYWNVFVETEKGTYESDTAYFVTGLSENEWNASWITGDFKNAPIFQKKFTLSKLNEEAYAYICGLGYFELYINKKRVGDDYFTPNQTDYEEVEYYNLPFNYDGETEKRINYLGYDVTNYINLGENTVEIWLANGWYKNDARAEIEGLFKYDELKMIFQLNCGDFELVSDESWEIADGPLVLHDIFHGEIYDANVVYENSFKPVRLAKTPKAEFLPQIAPTDKLMEELTPVKVTENVYDIGKNVTGFIGLRCKGQKGSKIVIKYAECLTDNKLDFKSTTGYVESDQNQIQKDVYILSGDGEEFYRPRFVWHGFRYFEIEAENAQVVDLKAYFVYTSVEQTGNFECSNETINGIHNIYLTTQKAVIHGAVPMDCPHRERLGYTGDGQASSYSAMFNLDCRNFHKKWIEDILGAQIKETGYVPHTAPFRGGAGGPAWGSSIAVVPWNYYLHYGDKELIKKCLPQIEKWILYLKNRLDDKGLVNGDDDSGWCLGDWCLALGEDVEWSNPHHDLIKVPSHLVNTCMYIHCINIYRKIIKTLKINCYDFSKELSDAKEAVNNEYLNEHYSAGTQGCDVFPLYADIVPEDKKEGVINSLKKNIENNDFTIDTGIFGTGYMLNVLAKYGLNDYAYKLLTQTKYPSYGNMLKKGATSLWETWEGSGSRSHEGLGSFNFWLYHELAGIKPSEIGGFKEFIISPYFPCNMDYVEASYLTNYGYIRVNWQRNGINIAISITVPFNTTAHVNLNGKKFDLTCGTHKFQI